MVRLKNIVMKAFICYKSKGNLPIGYIYTGELQPDGFIEMKNQSLDKLKEYPELVNLLKSMKWDNLKDLLQMKIVEV